jgi:hypothetical protein
MKRFAPRHFVLAAAIALGLGFGLAYAQTDPALLPADHPDAVVEYAGPETVMLETDDGLHEIRVDVAVTPRAFQRGLMFREELGPDEGMLFFYDQPQEASFWMKNTLIPLDLLFIEEDGTVAKIVRNAVPGSLASMRSGVPVAAVLEINGGRAGELGVEPGSTLRHLVFGNMP